MVRRANNQMTDDSQTESGAAVHCSAVVRPPSPNYDDGVEYAEERCPKCDAETFRRDCTALDCEDGYYHDCGEDCCCCACPEPNRKCDECEGHGVLVWCPVCGWDLLQKRYINGRDARERPNDPDQRPGELPKTL